jgi:single-strand DNA-binding protein
MRMHIVCCHDNMHCTQKPQFAFLFDFFWTFSRVKDERIFCLFCDFRWKWQKQGISYTFVVHILLFCFVCFMSYEAVGTLFAVYPTTQVSDKFRKREFVLEIQDGNYTQHVKFQTVQDKCDVLDRYRKGEGVKVLFNLRGRMGTTRSGDEVCFTNLDAWRIERADMNGGDRQDSNDNFGDDDIPF